MTSLRSRRSDKTDNIVPLSPGKRLQKAREALHLSLPDIAARLRLREDIVQAVEDDRYEELSPVYARGYLRSYGRLLGIDPEGLIKAYDDIAEEDPQTLRSVTTPDLRDSARKGEGLTQWVGYAVVVILSGVLLAWWQSREVEIPQPISSLVSEPGEFASELKALPSPGEPASVESDPSHQVIVLSGETSAPEAEDQNAEPSTAGESTTPRTEGSLGVIPESGAPGEDPVQLPQQTEASGSPSASGPRLVLQLSDDSWNQVIDNQGNLVAHGLAKGGESIQIPGEPPFKAVIGNSPGVMVLYDGQAIDISPFSHGGVARFTLEADGRLSP